MQNFIINDEFYVTFLFYLLCCICLCVSPFRAFPVFLVFCPITDFYAKIPTFYANIPCYLVFYMWYCAWCAVGGGGGGPCVARSHIQPCKWWYPGVQFILPSRSSIMGPSLAPVPAGDWGAELHRSSVSRTLQRRLGCVRLPTPVLSKGFFPFLYHDSTQLREHG